MRSVVKTNLISTHVTTDAFIPLLKKSKAPPLLFISSSLGSITKMLDPRFSMYGLDNKPYSTSKAALNMLAAVYSVQLGREGLKVNAICPGFRATRMNGYTDNAGKPKKRCLCSMRLDRRYRQDWCAQDFYCTRLWVLALVDVVYFYSKMERTAVVDSMMSRSRVPLQLFLVELPLLSEVAKLYIFMVYAVFGRSLYFCQDFRAHELSHKQIGHEIIDTVNGFSLGKFVLGRDHFD